MRIRNFDEFEGEFINCSDYISEQFGENISNNETLEKNWSLADSQKLSEQITGVQHPWNREQYEKYTDPKVKENVSYEEYISMWNMKSTDDEKVNINKDENIKQMNSLLEKARKITKPIFHGTSGYNNHSTSGYGTDNEIINNFVQKYPAPKPKEFKIPDDNVKTDFNSSVWKSIKIENRIMIIFMIIGTILSFITVLILMAK